MSLVCSLSIAAVAAGLWGSDQQATAAPKWKLIVPHVAADSARGPTPTPTPLFDTDRFIRVEIRIHARELAATGEGTLPVLINASAEGPMRGVLDAPMTVTGQFSITPEGSDSAGCNWGRVDATTAFKMTIYYNSRGNLDALLGIVSPTWHYDVACKNGSFRSPKTGEEGLELFLRDLMTPYLTSEVENGLRLPLQAVSGSGPDQCIKRKATFSGRGVQTKLAEVGVWVYQPDYPGACNPHLPPEDDPAPLRP